MAGYLKRLDAGDDQEKRASGGGGRSDDKLKEKIAAIQGKRDRHKAMLADLERTGEDQVSLTDPDSRAMARMTKVGVGYNVQLAVDAKHKLIVEQEVCNQVLDMGLLAPTVEAAMATLGVDRIEAVADNGYFKIEEVEACEKTGITAYLPKPVRGPAVRKGFFAKEAFRFDPETTSIHAQPVRRSHPAGEAARATTSRSTTRTGPPAGAAPFAHAARRRTGMSRGWRTRPCSTAWPLGWRRALTSSTVGVRPSSTRSAPSNSGWVRARS